MSILLLVIHEKHIVLRIIFMLFLAQFESNAVCPRSLGPIYILGYYENKSKIAIRNVEEGLQIWVKLIRIQHYIQKPALGLDHDLTVKKNRIRSLKTRLDSSLKKPGSEQNRICPSKQNRIWIRPSKSK